MRDTERRYTRGLVEVRGQDRRTIGGYAAKFGRLSQNLGGFVERINPGFFAKSAGDGFPDVMARYNHDDAFLLGTTAARTLRLNVDEVGLDYTVDPPPSFPAHVLESIGRGDVRQSSFAFRTADQGDDWGMTEQGFPLRTLLSGQLVDVAPVNTPAYPDTSTGLRSLAESVEADPAEVEAAARRGELRKFFGGPPARVIDLGESRTGGAGLEAELQQTVAGMSADEADALGAAAEAANAETAAGGARSDEQRSRFEELVAKLMAKGHSRDSAERLAAYIGRKKYGKAAFQAMAGKGRAADDAGTETTTTGGQGDTHPLLAVRQRHAALMGKRRAPLEQGDTHSAPSEKNDAKE